MDEPLVRPDVGELQGEGLRNPKAGGVGRQHRRAIAEVRRRQQQAFHFLHRHVAGQPAGHPATAQPFDEFRPAERLAVEEPERRKADVGRARAEASLDPGQQPGADLFRVKPVWRGLAVPRKVR